jgi:hypothetical protein
MLRGNTNHTKTDAMSGLISIDNGGYSTCIKTKNVLEVFPSVKGYYGDRTITEAVGKYDYIVEYENEKFVMGNIAKYDCDLKLKMFSESKQDIFFDLSILVAIHQFGYAINYIVVSVPIAQHTDTEKQGIVKRLVKNHTITVNGQTKTFNIAQCTVSPETVSAFWINRPYGKSQWLDIGSRTLGYGAVLYDNGACRFLDSESGTFHGKGLEILQQKQSDKAIAKFIQGNLSHIWKKDDVINVHGGGALKPTLVDCLLEHYPNLSIVPNPQTANARGMYELGKMIYKMA